MPSREGQVCGAWLPRPHFFYMFVFFYFILYVFGCAGSLLSHMGFL